MKKNERPNLDLMLIQLNSYSPKLLKDTLSKHYIDCFNDNMDLIAMNELAIKLKLTRLSFVIVEILDERIIENKWCWHQSEKEPRIEWLQEQIKKL